MIRPRGTGCGATGAAVMLLSGACAVAAPPPPAPTPAAVAVTQPSSHPTLTVTRNVWMDPHSRFPAEDRYNAGELIPQVESEIAVDPNNPNNIIATAVYFGGVLLEPPAQANTRGSGGRSLATRDGGLTWTAVAEPPFGRYNLRTAYSRRYGDAYRYGGGGTQLPWIDVQRSDDKGQTWTSQHTERTVDGFRTIDTDQGNMVVDNWPNSPFYGRIYLAPHHYRFWYNDARGAPDGWQISTERLTPGGTVFTSGLEVLPDGTVALAFRRFVRGENGDWELHLNLVLSLDGGRTFTEPRPIVQLDFLPFRYPTEPDRAFYSNVSPESRAWFASDPTTGRFHVAFMKRTDGRHRIFATSSADRGESWSSPVPVSPGFPEANQYQVRAAVNEEGELGVLWLDTRHNPGDTGYDAYFAISGDRGRTFREVRVSEVSSRPAWDFNQHEKPRETWRVPGFDARRHLTGGDYIGLRADPAGDFVMTWPDARHERRQQMYFAKVSVARYNFR
jgi:hypothetical protein